jgi:hypothetical protein
MNYCVYNDSVVNHNNKKEFIADCREVIKKHNLGDAVTIKLTKTRIICKSIMFERPLYDIDIRNNIISPPSFIIALDSHCKALSKSDLVVKYKLGILLSNIEG